MDLVEIVIAMPPGTPPRCTALHSALGQRYRPLRIIACGSEVVLPADRPEGVEWVAVRGSGQSLAALYNRAAEVARGVYVTFVEPSHELDPLLIERCLAALAAAPSDVAFVAAGRGWSARCQEQPLRLLRRALGPAAGALVAPPALFRRKALGPGALFDESLSTGLEHLELGLRLRASDTRGLFLPEPLVGRGVEDGEPSDANDAELRRDLGRLLARYPRLGAQALYARPSDAARVLWPGRSQCDDATTWRASSSVAAFGSPTISVLLVNWNSRDDLAECLRSLEVQTDRSFETLIVDNGSTDGSVQMVRREFPWAELVETGENLGFAEGCNRGIARCTGEWIATVNNDAVVDSRFIAEMRAVARQATERVGMIQARLVFRERPSHTNSTGVVVEPNGVAYDRDFTARLRASDEPEEIFCPTAGAALYRRAMLEQTRLPSGYFDRTFFMYFEDVDLGWRCRLAGWSALYVPSALVYHAFHGSAGRHGNDFVVRQCRANRIRCMVKNASPTMIVRSTPRTLSWLAGSMTRHGWGAVRDLTSAARSAWKQRALVSGLAVRERRSVERRWLQRPRKIES